MRWTACAHRLLALALGLALLGQSRPAKARVQLQPPQMERLARYDVLSFAETVGGGLSRHRAIGVFDATPEEILRVAQGYDRYGEYLPRITGHALQTGAEETLVLLEADLPWPLRNLWVHARYQRDALPDRSYRLRFVMVRGNVQRYEGSLLIEPFAGGRSSVTYELLAQPGIRLPRSWLEDAVHRGTMTFVHCLRSRINHLLRSGVLRPPGPVRGLALAPRP